LVALAGSLDRVISRQPAGVNHRFATALPAGFAASARAGIRPRRRIASFGDRGPAPSRPVSRGHARHRSHSSATAPTTLVDAAYAKPAAADTCAQSSPTTALARKSPTPLTAASAP
jgi:hypothetical protein